MSSYDVEHGIDGSRGSNSRGGGHDGGRAQEGRGRRPDLSTFFSILDLVNTDGEPARPQHNTNAVPLPADVSAAFRTLANSLLAMREYNRGRDPMATSPGADSSPGIYEGDDLLARLVRQLLQNAEDPPRKVEGVSNEFLDGLDRLDVAKIKKDAECPICGNLFLDDKYPLVVRLPCNSEHVFDLECIGPWLKLNPTCPLDRKNFVKKEVDPKETADGTDAHQDEADWDNTYA